jgi:DNA repair exonuclease SbcCD ATPase subunit
MELTRLVLKNFRTHRSALFEFGSGVTGIVGGNGSGKSSIVEAIIFLLTGEGYGKTKSDMLTVGQTSGYVIGHLIIGGKEAILERHIDTAKVNFMYDGKTYKKSSEVNDIWNDLFQIDKNIVQNVIVSNQGEIALLFNGDNSTKEKLFQKIFMVPNTTKLRDTIWNSYIKTAPPEYPVKDTAELSSDIQCVEKLIDMEVEELAALPVDEERYAALLSRQSFLKSVQDAEKNNSQLINTLERTVVSCENLRKDKDQLQGKVSCIPIDEYRTSLAELKAAKPNYEKKLEYQLKKAALQPPILIFGEAEEKELKELDTQYNELDTLRKSTSIAIANIDKKIAVYRGSNTTGGTCPTCGSEVADPTQLLIHLLAEKEPLVDAYDKQSKSFEEAARLLKLKKIDYDISSRYKSELKDLDYALDLYKNAAFDQEEYDLCSGVVLKYNELEHKLNAAEAAYKQAEIESNRLKLKLASAPVYDKDAIELEGEVAAINNNIKEFQQLREKAKAVEISLASRRQELKSLKQELKDNESYKDKNAKRKEYTGVLNSVYELFHTTKFPRALIHTYASTVSEYMNSVLESFNFPYKASVNESFGIDIFNEEGLQLPAISGGQQVMVGFSLRLALHNMFVGAFPFMIVDEGSYGLNSENAVKYFEIIKSLGKSSKFKQVIVIDHHSELSEYVDNTIQL